MAIAAAKQRDLNDLAEIKKIAEQYGLPYNIAEQQEQWFIYSPTMKSDKSSSGSSGGSTTPSGHKNVFGWGWRRGDVVWVNGAGSVTGVPGHNAMIWGEGTEVYLNDATPDLGVARRDNVQAWMDKYTEVRALTPRLNWDLGQYTCYSMYGSGYGCSDDSYKRINAWWYTQNRLGYPYNMNFLNPRDTTKFYCSSLIWSAYNSVGYNIIAPWTLGPYGMITPNSIKDSNNLVTFKVSTI